NIFQSYDIELEICKTMSGLGQEEEAIKRLEIAISNCSDVERSNYFLFSWVDIMLISGNSEAAIEALQRIPASSRYFIRSRKYLANIALEKFSDKTTYIACFREIVTVSPVSENWLLLGNAYMSLQMPEKAIEINLCSYYPNNVKDPFCRYIGQHRESIDLLISCKNDPLWEPLANKAILDNILDLSVFDGMEPRAADEENRLLYLHATKKLKIDSLEREVYTSFGQLLSAKKSEADAIFNNMEIMNNDAVPYQLLQAVAFLSLKQVPKAKLTLKRLGQSPWTFENGEWLEKGWLLLAKIYINSNKGEQAKEFCQRVLKYNASSLSALELMGSIAEREHSYSEAAKSYGAVWKRSKCTTLSVDPFYRYIGQHRESIDLLISCKNDPFWEPLANKAILDNILDLSVFDWMESRAADEQKRVLYLHATNSAGPQKMSKRVGSATDPKDIAELWRSHYSAVFCETFPVLNGVRRGGVLSLFLYSLYVDDLNLCLAQTGVGCFIGGVCFSNLGYVDDLVILAPTLAPPNHLISISDEFASANDIVFNTPKTQCMAFIPRGTPLTHIPMAWLSGVSLYFVGSYKYLVFTVAPTLSDELHVKALSGRDTVQNEGSYSKNIYLGVATGTRSDLLTLEYPIQHGIVTDFEAMEQIFQHIFHQELCIDPEEYPVLLTEAPFNPEAKRNTMIKMLFEKFNIPQLRVEKAPILSLLDMRKKTGIVVDCGDDVTHVIPVYDGNILLKDCSSVNLGDRDVKNHLRSTLMKSNRGVDFKSDTLYHIQEKKCLVALDFEKEMASFHEQSWWRKRKISKENSYKLPDGKVITIGNESIRSTEVLFQPSLFGKRGFGITEALYDSIMNVDIRFRDTLSSNIFFIGPIIKYPGFAERIRKDIPSTTELSV
ncbi:hypothetical protein QYM36_007018, partial [Artemia franciscana]